MGQYYAGVVIGKNDDIKILWPYDFDNGLKLMEFSWCGNNFVNAVLSCIHNKKAKVVFIGDYADSPYDGDDDYYASIMPKESFMKYYKTVWKRNEKSKFRKNRFTKDELALMDMDTKNTYILNHDKRLFIDIAGYIQKASMLMNGELWAVNPLPLLTVCGNGRGGGDFHSGSTGFNDVGTWAFDTLEYTGQIPEGYKEAHFIFQEGKREGDVAHG